MVVPTAGRVPIRRFARQRLLPLLLVVSCMISSTGAHAGAERHMGAIAFEPCVVDTGMGARYVAECGSFRVAENADLPRGRQLDLRLVLLASRALQPREDLVVYLAGGPGQSSIDVLPAIAPALAQVLSRRHVLLIEQRGTGATNRLDCPVTDRIGSLDDAAFARACRARLEGRADLTQYTTSRYVDDLEAVRRAIGSPNFDLIASSYGTRVAQEYRRRHPSAIRALVLDGVVPPSVPLMQDHARNLDAVVAALFAACEADAACATRFPHGAEALERLLADLDRRPLDVAVRDPITQARDTVRLDRTRVAGLLRQSVYEPHLAATVPFLVHEAAEGRLEALAQQVAMQPREGVSDFGLEWSVFCTEDLPFLPAHAEGGSSLLGHELSGMLAAQCAQWPRGRLGAGFREPLSSPVPTLLIAGEHDPVTPPRYAELVASTLPAAHLFVLRGQGHSNLGAGCLPLLIHTFLERAGLDGVDTGCLDRIAPAPFVMGLAGPGA